MRASRVAVVLVRCLAVVGVLLSGLLDGPLLSSRLPVGGDPRLGGEPVYAQPVNPAKPAVTVVQTGPPLAPLPGLLVQWQPLPGAVTVVVKRLDPFFKTWGLNGGGATQQLDTDVKPGQQYQYQVCAGYSGPDLICSDPVGQAAPGGESKTEIYISAVNPYTTAMGVQWATSPKTYYNGFQIRYRQQPWSGSPPPPANVVDGNQDGDHGYHEVPNLESNTFYFFSVRGGISDGQWSDWSPEYLATTKPAADMIDRPKPSIVFKESGDTWIAVGWNVDYGPKPEGRGHYAKFIISLRLKSPPNSTETKDTEDGLQVSHTFNNLKPGTTYIAYVYGCNLNLGLNGPPGDDCAVKSDEVEITTKTPTTGSLVPALLSAEPKTVTAGNRVVVKGSAFPNPGPVSLTLVGPKGSVDLGTGTVTAGAFNISLRIPAGTAAGSYKIHAEGPGAQADVEVAVVAPSSKGTLTVTSGGQVYTAIDLDNSFTLSGTNFTPGPVTIFVDSASGPQIGTATVGANGTFQLDVTVKSALGKAVFGAHKIVAVQSGAVTGELAVTFVLPEVIH